MIYTYTMDLPYQDPALNRRAYYKLPRSILLAPYLATNDYFVDYTNAIDEIFESTVDAKIDALAQIRNMWVTTKALEEKSAANKMLDFSDWGGPERAVIVSQTNLLGVKLSNAGIISEKSYRAIAKFLGSYWFEKGKASMMDFVNFCLGTNLVINRLWTKDYVFFVPEGSPKIGATIYDTVPGPWYPTTHVKIQVPDDYYISVTTLSKFFYEISNYNLILFTGTDYDIPIPEGDPVETKVVALVMRTANVYKMFFTEIDIEFDNTQYGSEIKLHDADGMRIHNQYNIPMIINLQGN